MVTANASKVLMVKMSGLVLIALPVLAPLTSPGLVLLSTLTTCILGPSAPTRVSVIALLENANALLVTKVLLASVLCALITVMIKELAGLRSILLPRLDVSTMLLGML
jgi:hypothetical protein